MGTNEQGWLVLSRRKNESISIGGTVTVKVVRFQEVNGHQEVVLGFNAPQNVQIVRDDCVNRTPKDRSAKHGCERI